MALTDRDSPTASVTAALYYPYVHIRSEHWLKATLLCFPVVKRIVPDKYTPEDTNRIREYANVTGPHEQALLQPVPSRDSHDAQKRLLEKLEEHSAFIEAKYSRAQAPPKDEYWIQDAKFADRLLEHLRRHGLAWPSYDPVAVGHREWSALHPTLGSAIMTTLGLSIAGQEHYDIVTDSGRFHEALLATRESDVFDVLLDRMSPQIKSVTQASQELGELVIALAGVNLEAIQPQRLKELHASAHFADFQRLIRTAAGRIDRRETDHVYHRQLQDAADEIIQAWNDTLGDVSGDLRNALGDQAGTAVGEGARYLITGAADVYTAGALAIGVLFSAGRKHIGKKAGPYQYLSEVVGAQDKGLRLSSPLGLER